MFRQLKLANDEISALRLAHMVRRPLKCPFCKTRYQPGLEEAGCDGIICTSCGQGVVFHQATNLTPMTIDEFFEAQDDEPSATISTPWVNELVIILNKLQDRVALYACSNKSLHPDQNDTLVATTDGWVCPSCDYTQIIVNPSAWDNALIPSDSSWLRAVDLSFLEDD